MDDKKKPVTEETNEVEIHNDDVVEFDDIRNALNKLEAKKASLEKEMADKVEKNEEENSSKEEVKQIFGVVGGDDTSKIKAKDDVKVEEKVSDEKKEPEEKDESDEKKELEKKDESDEKTKESSDKNESDKKEESGDKKEPEKKDESDEKKDADKKDTKAITQSKRLADAKAAETTKNIDTASDDKKSPVKKEQKGKKGVAIFFGVVLVLLLGAYIGGFVYFSNYFYPNVAINGVDVSNMDQATAKKTLDDFNKNYVLTLETIDGKQITIAGSDIEMNIKLHDEFDDCLKKQEAYLWFMNLMNHHDFAIGADATWNADALDQLYRDMKMLDKKLMTAPKDAYIGIEDGKFTIIAEELGTTVKVDNFKTTVNDSLSSVVASVNLKDAGCYELPKVYSDDEALSKEISEKSEFIGGVITLQLDDLTLEPGMELYDAVLEKKGDSYAISKTKVQNYVKELAAEYDTMGTERVFTSSFENGRQVKISGTAFGYEMDQEATANALYTALQAKKATTVEAIFKTKGYTLQGENDIGDTYIEVNLSLQKVIAYKDGKKVVEGDCVSGCEANGNGTCLGLYKIQDKLSPTVLRGQQKPVTKTITKKNKKGKKVKVEKTTMEYEYESPVTYWLQFNGGYGLHDAAGWRSVYGGTIYYYNGSHGCVNLPYDVAQKLYENFQLEDPVVVYFWDNENRK